jgi:hypothetical protein
LLRKDYRASTEKQSVKLPSCNRCRYKGPNGIKRWVGLGVIADNLINIGRALAAATSPRSLH